MNSKQINKIIADYGGCFEGNEQRAVGGILGSRWGSQEGLSEEVASLR